MRVTKWKGAQTEYNIIVRYISQDKIYKIYAAVHAPIIK